MRGVVELWRWWTATPSSARGARRLYAAMALGFVALAVGGVVASDALVAVVAAIVAVATAGLAVVAPKLAREAKPNV